MNIRIEINDENIGPPPRVRKPRAMVPNTGAMLGMVPVLSPFAVILLLKFTLFEFHALRSKVLFVATPLPIALGFELACIAALCMVMMVTRGWWKAKYYGWNKPHEILYWKRFLIGWFLSAYLSNCLLSYSPTPEQVLIGVSHWFQNGWWVPIALFPLFLVPWGDINHE